MKLKKIIIDEPEERQFTLGSTLQLSALLTKQNSKNDRIVWSSSDGVKLSATSTPSAAGNITWKIQRYKYSYG